jgi:plastocyanin
MEQKQLDEIDESYFGEEFIDEEVLAQTSKSKVPGEEVKIESLEEPKPKKKSTKKKADKKADVEKEETVAVKVDEAVSKVKTEPEIKSEVKEEPVKPKIEIIDETKPKIDTLKEEKPNKEIESGKSVFTETSTWKAITGIVVILLIFSISTQGFQFMDEGTTGATTANIGKEISIEKAEERVLDYVNNYVLREPFVAVVVDKSQSRNLYKFVLEIADQRIDSFITKDGRLFFPEGVDISSLLIVENVEKDDDTVENEVDLGDVEVIEVENDDVEIEVPIEVPSGSSELTLTAKKWLFSPHQLTANEGDTVSLTINSENLDFTFVIPELGVEEEVSGITTIEFEAKKSGSYEFSCSSCDDWRGMSGTLVVS